MKYKIILDFETRQVEAELFDNKVAQAFYKDLPYKIELTQWGGEYYGPIDKKIEENQPVEKIPVGGLAYTPKGNYFCIFLGQNPAWPVEYIGRIADQDLNKLKNINNIEQVTVQQLNK